MSGSGTLDFESRFVNINGYDIHYIDEGAGTPLVLLHGNSTSIYGYRHIIPHLLPHARVIALDLLGFGKSQKDKSSSYDFQVHYSIFEAFVERLGLKNIVVVGHDWGATIGINFAVQHPENVAAVAFFEAIIPPTFPMKDISEFGRFSDVFAAMRSEESGRRMVIDENYFIEHMFFEMLRTPLTEEERNHYREPFLEPWTREPLYVWPLELPIAGEPQRNVALMSAIEGWFKSSKIPKLVMYAEPGAVVPPQVAAWMSSNLPSTESQYVGRGTHYLQEEAHQGISRALVEWLTRTALPASRGS